MNIYYSLLQPHPGFQLIHFYPFISDSVVVEHLVKLPNWPARKQTNFPRANQRASRPEAELLQCASLLTYVPGQLPPSEAHADGDVEAVGVLGALVAVRCRDVDGRRQGNAHVHRDDRPRPESKPRGVQGA